MLYRPTTALILWISVLAATCTLAFGQDDSAGTDAESGPSQSSQPNIVFVITDDQRADWLSAAGHPDLETPQIDRLAVEGALFTNFFTTTPLCSPSRASFLTGQYPHTHGVINNDKLGLDVISHTLMTFPRRLREEGYETAFIGKWHMGLDDSRRPGYDHWISFKGQGLYIDPVVNVNGESRQLDGYMTDFLNREAEAFVLRARERPFLLYLSHKAVHYPFLPAERHDSLYRHVAYTPPVLDEADLAGKPVLSRTTGAFDHFALEGVAPEPVQPRRGRGTDESSILRDQMRTLISVDEGVGMVLDALEETGQLDNTIFIFTSDNGYLLGEHGRFTDKRFAYDEAIRIPFVLRYPPLVEAGSRIDAMALNIDVAPTLLELAGVEPVTRIHGRSIVPLFEDQTEDWRDSFLAEHFLEKVVPAAPAWKAVRTRNWKYIHYPDLEGMDELYDLENDPGEIHNRIADPEAQSVLDEMEGELDRLMQASR